jgi:pentatricopeptide repeat protein
MQLLDFPYTLVVGIWDAFGSEVALLALFCAGFMLFRTTAVKRLFGGPQKWVDESAVKSVAGFESDFNTLPSWMLAAKQIEANWAAGRADLVLSDWPQLKHFTIGCVRAIIEAMISVHLEADVVPTLQRILARDERMCTQEVLMDVLDVVEETCPDRAAAVRSTFSKAISKAFRLSATCQGFETSSDAPEHGHIQRISAAVQSKQLAKATQHLFAMRDAGFKIPGHCLVMFARLAIESEEGRTVLKDLPTDVITNEGIVAILEYAAKGNDIFLLREMYTRVDMDYILATPPLCEALLRGYASLGDSRAMEVFEEVVQTGFQPSESLLTALISLCAESRHVQMAEHALKYACSTHGHATLPLYAAMMKVYGHSRMYEKTCDLYATMQKDGVRPDTVVYGSLIKAAVESGRLELARQLFRESGNPDLLNCMSLIRAAGRERDVPKALELLADLEAAPLAIDATAYNCVLEVCVACGHREAAEGLLRRMEAKGQVDVVSYNTYLKILFLGGSRAEVGDVLQAMRTRGLRPNAVTYNSLVKDAVNRQDLHGAWKLIADMEQEGTKPDAFTCSILMKGVKHTSCADDVDKIISLIHRAKVTPDEVLVNCLLDACVRFRNIPRLTQVLEQFKSTGVVPSLHACAMLIKAYGHSRRLDKAWELWRELTVDRKVSPNEEVFASMVDACLASGELDHAVNVFREMKHVLSEFSRGPAVFSALIKACVQRKQTKLALEIYEEMRDVSFTCSKVTYNTLIDALIRQGDMETATSIFRDMTLNGVTPDLISYSTLIKGHCARGCLEEGLQLLGLMQRRGISPDAIVFNSILDGCAHKQMRTLTEQVLKDMEKANIAPSNFTLSILVKLYGRCTDLDTAFQVVETYPAKYHFKLNAQVYTCLMSACIANNALGRALEVYESMIKSGCPSDAKMYHTLLSGCVRHSNLDMAASLMEDALGKSPPCLDRETAENVLFMMARRGRAGDLGERLLDRCEEAGIAVSDRVSGSIRRREARNASDLGVSTSYYRNAQEGGSRLHQRRGPGPSR